MEAIVDPLPRGPDWMPITPKTGSLFHADSQIVHQRFSRWAKSGVFERIFRLLASDHDNEYMMLDATIVRAHQHSAGARKKTARKPSADRAAD
jgi:transposase